MNGGRECRCAVSLIAASRPAATAGFTLIELLTVLAVAALLAGLALPCLRNLVLGADDDSAAERFVTALEFARSQAMALGVRVVVCRSGAAGDAGVPACDQGRKDAAHDGYEDGWIVFADRARDWQPADADAVLARDTGFSDHSLSLRGQGTGRNADHIGFTPLGLAAGTAGSLALCDARGWSQGGRFAQVLIVNLQGRIKTASGDSPALSVDSCTP